MRIPPALTAKILALAGEAPKAKRAKPGELVPMRFLCDERAWNDVTATWWIPFACVNESNERAWKGRHARAGAAWRVVRKAVHLEDVARFEVWLENEGTVYAKFTRLGGKRLDPLVNLPASLKGVEDAFAYLCGVDDGSPLWVPRADQEPGGLVGVRVELSLS